MQDINKHKRKAVTESQLYMWRTLFAMSHADDNVSENEIRLMSEVLEDIPFTEEQKILLKDDIKNPKDITDMFGHITDVRDQAEFFHFAREMVWADGDFGKEEQDILLKLKKMHLQSADLDDLVGNVNLQFADDDSNGNGTFRDASQTASKTLNRRGLVFSFRDRFLSGLR